MIKRIISSVNKPVFLISFFVFTAFVLRLLTWKTSIAGFGKEFAFVQPDAFYHFRRAMIWAINFPKMPTLDYYMAYPYGAECPWPPLYDWLVAVLANIITLGNPTQKVVGLIIALMPPILAGLCVIPTYKIVKLIWNNERIALFSAFFAITMPGMLGYSHVASGDHHVAETFLCLWFFYYGLFAVKNALNGLEYRKESLLSGLFITLGLLVWQGQVVFYTLFCFYVFCLFFIFFHQKELVKKIGNIIIFICLITSPILAFVRFIVPRSTEQTLWDFGFFSYFQPSYVLFLAVVLYALGYLIIRSESFIGFMKKILILIIVSGIAGFVIKPFRENLIRGIKFLLKTDPWHASINEFQKTFSFEMFWPLNIDNFLNVLYFVSFMLPMYYGLRILLRAFKDKKKNNLDPMEIFFMVWGIGIGILGLYQKRWNNAYSPALAIGIGIFSYNIIEKIKGGHGLFKEFMQWKESHKGERVSFITRFLVFSEKSPFFVALIIVCLFLTPYYFITKDLLRSGMPMSLDLYRTLIWMKNYLPPTSHVWNPVQRPEYGIFAPWDHGHYIQFISEKPTIVNNFGHQLRGDGFKDAIYIWSVETEEELQSIFDKYNARFILVSNPIPFFGNPIIEYLKPNFLEKYIMLGEGHFGMPMPVPRDSFYSLPLANLWEFDGTATHMSPAQKHFRLVFESENLDIMPYHYNEVKEYKIYEYVKSARVVGKTEPRSLIYVKADFITNWDRTFTWETTTYANENGEFNIFLPYATGEDNIFIKPLSPYVIMDGKNYVEIATSNEDVYTGKFINVDLRKGKVLPTEGKKLYQERIKSLVGAVATKDYINIHKKP
ncbi:MAG: hypothetical protein N2202_09420 [Proteobacteria bacterium]|nr:hypothetical protein [Pseudomonadota bacterium]